VRPRAARGFRSNVTRGRTDDGFRRLAASYDRLRPVDRNWLELLGLLVSEGDLIGRRVLDVGCGTGRVAAALAERGARVWGVEPSPEMLAAARASLRGKGLPLRQARAEALPFRPGSFERAVMRLVVHLVDRDRAFPEIARVLDADGRLVLATFRREHFDRLWLAPYFPSVRALDEARFADAAALTRELRAAGFESVRVRPVDQHVVTGRDEALERIRGRFISTLHLVSEEEFWEGLARAERELPERLEYDLAWAILAADRPSVRVV
jgi:ubiquinone/menaquinone biosynthesis C-methylase UbiE